MPANDARRYAVEYVTIDENHGGQRLDNYLLSRLNGVPRSVVYRVIRSGQVRINMRRVAPASRLAVGDVVRVPPLTRRIGQTRRPGVPADVRAMAQSGVLYEDDDMLVINKPAGVASHAGTGIAVGVIEGLRQLNPQWGFLELVHRLDRDTSGCLMLAKNRRTLLVLHAALRGGQCAISKQYLGLVRGQWRGGRRDVRVSLRTSRPSGGDRITVSEIGGRTAHTEYGPLERFDCATLMQILLFTGRTHQIRAHSAHVGHPLAGDRKYGDSQFNRQMRELGLQRLFLHASQIAITHPHTRKPLDISAPLPEELQSVLSGLRMR
ncbi:MAG: RluA family pseudouridine synthase [Gammaproteobacteria bacterium]|nr:RluA family pseudouridine synthase [Gammaproteobacteria bacterium]MDH3468143.1 RluA family pseudouridine synthase [Gammaproteobacteria bacterium]